MKSISFYVSMLVFAFGLAGCKSTSVDNGEVPSTYIADAKKLEGNYSGQFNKVAGTLAIHFEGNRPVLSFTNKNGTDILDRDCQSKIGNLREFTPTVTSGEALVTTALFDFDPGLCRNVIEGRQLRVDIKSENGKTVLGLSLPYAVINRHYYCGSWGGWDGSVCLPEARFEYSYLYGQFSR